MTSIAPDEGENTGSVAVVVTGSAFKSGATLRLRRSGQPDRVASGVTVSASQITGTLDSTGPAVGLWDVVVTNPDAEIATLVGGSGSRRCSPGEGQVLARRARELIGLPIALGKQVLGDVCWMDMVQWPVQSLAQGYFSLREDWRAASQAALGLELIV